MSVLMGSPEMSCVFTYCYGLEIVIVSSVLGSFKDTLLSLTSFSNIKKHGQYLKMPWLAEETDPCGPEASVWPQCEPHAISMLEPYSGLGTATVLSCPRKRLGLGAVERASVLQQVGFLGSNYDFRSPTDSWSLRGRLREARQRTFLSLSQRNLDFGV